jgi:hypothetical protein
MWNNRVRLWNNRVQFQVVASPQTALTLLNRAKIPVYSCKKQKKRFTFCVDEQYCKKVFAIFKHPCYNISTIKISTLARFKNLALARAGILVGAFLFLCIVIFADSTILRVQITGNGAYLQKEILAILSEHGIATRHIYKGIDEPAITARVLSLPNVTFCSMQKRGSVFTLDVQVEADTATKVSYSPLVADRGGTVLAVVAICGTAEVKQGQTVKKGQTLIGAYDEQNTTCLAVGYCQLSCKGTFQFFAEEESELAFSQAYSALQFYAEQLSEYQYTVKKNNSGVVYEFAYSYIHTLTINFD